MWLDQQGGGVLMVASTNTVHADQVIRGLPHRDELRTTPARYSLAELERIRDRVRAAVGDLASAQVDVLGNRVEVWTGQPDRVRRALSGAAPAGAVAVRPVPAVTPTACPTVFDCGPPMRGGISVELGNANKEPMGTYCTSAFNIRDGRKNFYAMTAGHCFKLRPAAFYLINPRNDSVISERNSTRAAILDQRSPRVDFAITPIVNPDRWMPSGKRRNGVFMECSAEPMPNPCAGPRKSRYPITGMKNYGDMIIGEVVCMAGASPLTGAVKPGTRCGQITAKPDGAIQTNICAKLGDSGSPLFDQTTHTAYGVESGLAAGQVTGKCDPFDQVQTLYTPLSVILDTANQLTGVDYRLITNRDGD